MPLSKKKFISDPVPVKLLDSFPWFRLGIIGLLLLSLVLHFWRLSQFNTLVFDEIYYAKYAYDYLKHIPLFDAHPPLGKYAIALSLFIGKHLPFGQDTFNGYIGALFSTFSYRWLDALVGSLLPLVVAGIAYQLSRRRSYALIAGLFTTLDGLLLVESRYALINIYLVFFGLLGQYLFLLALERRGIQRLVWLFLAGVSLGASIAVKWNGLAFLLGVYLLWFAAWILKWVQRRRKTWEQSRETPWQKWTQLNIGQFLLCLGVLPVLIYYLVWLPHLRINAPTGFLQVHQQMLGFHEGMASNVHPYCSKWYTWPLMLRPMVYLYETARNTTEAVPLLPPLPAGVGKVIYDVHAMGNPALWWLSTIALLLLMGELVHQVWVWINPKRKMAREYPTLMEARKGWVGLYLLVNYAVNFLPWIEVNRCTFIYLYMGASVFGFLAIAWIVDRWLYQYKPWLRALGVTAIVLIVAAFIFWLPVYLGLPLSSEGFKIRMWFRSWI